MQTTARFRTNFGDEYLGSSFVPYSERAPVTASRRFRILKDSDLMPFGRYKDSPMRDVPAEHLDTLRDANWLDDQYPAVAEYIERNASAIDQDLERDELADWSGLCPPGGWWLASHLGACPPKRTASRRLYDIVSPLTRGFFSDQERGQPSAVFAAIRTAGGEVDIKSADYFGEMAGKRWVLSVAFGGFTFTGALIASFADRPNGDRYDLSFCVA